MGSPKGYEATQSATWHCVEVVATKRFPCSAGTVIVQGHRARTRYAGFGVSYAVFSSGFVRSDAETTGTIRGNAA